MLDMGKPAVYRNDFSFFIKGKELNEIKLLSYCRFVKN